MREPLLLLNFWPLGIFVLEQIERKGKKERGKKERERERRGGREGERGKE